MKCLFGARTSRIKTDNKIYLIDNAFQSFGHFLQEMVKYSIQWKMLVRCDQLTKQNRKIVRMTDILFCVSKIFHWNDYLPINKIRLSLNENKWKFRYCSTMTGSDIMKRPFVNLYEDTQLPCKKLNIYLKTVKIVIFRAN